MLVDYYVPFMGGKKSPPPRRVTITVDLDRPPIYKTWHAEAMSTLEAAAQTLMTTQRIPRVLKDKRGYVIGRITIK
mgnify:CR=1 FL=1